MSPSTASISPPSIEDGAPVTPERLAKPAHVQVLQQIREDGRAVSFFGDLHPSFAGNVVKAMGGVKQGWPVVAGALAAPRRSRPRARIPTRPSSRA